MEVCNICHQEIKHDQKYKNYFLTGKVHLACYNKAFRIFFPGVLLASLCLAFGIVILALGAAGVCGDWDMSGFLHTGGDIALFVIGIIIVILAIGFFISFPVRYFRIRKNPPLDK